jgi:hypothetical protein
LPNGYHRLSPTEDLAWAKGHVSRVAMVPGQLSPFFALRQEMITWETD